MMKKIRLFSAAAAAFLILSAAASSAVYASSDPGTYRCAENGYAYTAPEVEDKTKCVYDFDDLLTDKEESDLEKELHEVEEEKEITAVMVTTKNVASVGAGNTESARAYAEDFYDANAEGFRDNAFVMCIDMQNRAVYTVGHGRYASDKYVSFEKKIYDSVKSSLHSGNYYRAGHSFAMSLFMLGNYANAFIPSPKSIVLSFLVFLCFFVYLRKRTDSRYDIASHTPLLTIEDGKVISYSEHLVEHHSVSHNISSTGSGSGRGFSGGGHSSGGGGHFSGGGGGF